MTDDSAIFVDTNPLIYAATPSSPLYSVALTRLESLSSSFGSVWISSQIIREYVAVLSRVSGGAASSSLLQDSEVLRQKYRLAEDHGAVLQQLLVLLKKVPCGGKQVYDANIVATMIVNGVPQLLTHNVVDFLRFRQWIRVVPLVL